MGIYGNRVARIMRRMVAAVVVTGMLLAGSEGLQRTMTVLAEGEMWEGELYARAAVLMDAETGRVLYAKNGEDALANASTTKIMTCILILENCDINAVAEASSRAAGQPKVRLGMRSGQKFYVKDMLYALMLESFNDCAVVLAEHAAESVEAFAVRMNEKAKEIGCEDTYFMTPNGLDETDGQEFHHTTAEDLARIMRYCITQSPKAEEFLQITRTASYSFQEVDGNSSYTCNNHNALLTMMDGALTGKTGFTNQAGYCYVGAVEKEDRMLIAAVLGSGWPPNKNYKWLDITKLMDYGFDNFRLTELETQMTVLPVVKLTGCQTDQVELVQKGKLEAMISPEERLIALCRVKESIAGGVQEGTQIGSVDYYADGACLGTLPILTKTAGNALEYRDYLQKIWSEFAG